ncbi:MAG TPA: FHA domain-containing protein [Pyrinomonadaceae bacterium]
MSVLDKVRRWIDGDTAETVLEEAARDAQVKPRSAGEEFIVRLARAVEEVMQREMTPLPQGTVLIPSEYIIFLSEEDDKDWTGVRRRGLEQGLYHILAERAKEISGKKKLETQSFAVELRVDGTLEKGDVRVQHSWDDSSSNKTSILSRPKPQLPSQPTQQQQQSKPTNQVTPIPNFTPPSQTGASPNHPPPTVAQLNVQPHIPPQQQAPQSAYQPPPLAQQQQQQTPPFEAGDSEEMTHVKGRTTELYKLEIWRGGVRQNVVPIYQNEISVGRGSKSKPVDIPLAGDPEISRRHVTLICNEQGYFLINEGRNPAMVNNYEVPMGQRVSVAPGVPIAVCSYLLRIQPK